MGQVERPDANLNGNTIIAATAATPTANMARLGIIYALPDNMGVHNFDMAHRSKQSSSDLYSFFTRLGSYHVHNLLPENKKMAALTLKYSIILANAFGLGLWIRWLVVDFEGIKLFVSSVGVFIWGAFKLYEKYLDVKRKKRQDEIEESEQRKTISRRLKR